MAATHLDLLMICSCQATILLARVCVQVVIPLHFPQFLQVVCISLRRIYAVLGRYGCGNVLGYISKLSFFDRRRTNLGASGYSYETTYTAEALCTKYFTTSTTIYTLDTLGSGTYIPITEPRYPDKYPHTIYAPAVRFRSITKQTGNITASAWTPTIRSFGVTPTPTIDTKYSTYATKFKGSFAIYIGILLLVTLLALLALFWQFRRQKVGPKRDVQRNQTLSQNIAQNRFFGWKLHPLRSFGLGLSFSLVCVFPVGFTSCYFASREDWQKRLVTWSQDTSAVLRVLQVSSFFMRLLSTSLAWGIMSDVGWMLTHVGTSGAEMVALLDMSVVGGSYPYVSHNISALA